jgi:putative drug exporter of the RND superfamily
VVSTFLYRLGHAVARHKLRVLVAWLFLAAIVFGLAGAVGGKLIDDFTIPGTESQQGIDTLAERFPQASGTTGQVVFTSSSGPVVDQQAQIEDRIKAIEKVEHVTSVDDPFASGAVGTISSDKGDALSQIQFDVSLTDLPPDVVTEVEKAAAPPPGAKFTVSLGGSMYTSTGTAISATELIGVAVAFVVLAVTFVSLLAAGLPLLTAGLGVGITLAGILVVASVATVSSTTPTLAEMIGLAVGIDYGLFLVTRYRRLMGQGLTVDEAIAQSLATAGSAVVFAGTTVIIALCGLAVANIPFLTVMGIAASAGVAMAVLVAMTLLPAVLALFGEKLRPKPGSRADKVTQHAPGGKKTMGAHWVALITKVPALTVVVVILIIGVLAYPVKDLALSLPDNGSAEEGSPQRVTYDLIGTEFGPGYNAPLLVAADVITSTDPVGTVNKLADDIGKIDGVAAITKQTPNPTGDLGLVRVVPKWSQSDPRTAELVQRIRAEAPELESELGVADLVVTGQTAVAIDVSTRLAGALLPFGIVVVGLALILLMIVFRSIAVPIKATLGYLLSIMAALGVVSAVFIWGWFNGPLDITWSEPVVSFMPIIVMGVLFGLAMDYEVFLVSAIREDYVHHGDARHAVTTGFISSARVVTAAALIMITVFASFVPEGNSTIKPIALGLSVGVFVDAFLVRMTLVPAVMAMLGDKAWWLPKSWEKALPTIDVEGAALVRHVEEAEWIDEHGEVAIRADRLVLPSSDGPVTLDFGVAPGAVYGLEHPDPMLRSALAWTLAGRHKPLDGTLAVLGNVMPEEGSVVREQVRVVDVPHAEDDLVSVRRQLRSVLLAQSKRLVPSRRTLHWALVQAQRWIHETGTPSSSATAFEQLRLGSLTPLQRRLLGLSAAAVQGPRMIIVEDADAGLETGELDRLEAISREFAHHSGAAIILIGADLGPRADWRPAMQRERELALVGAGATVVEDEGGTVVPGVEETKE